MKFAQKYPDLREALLVAAVDESVLRVCQTQVLAVYDALASLLPDSSKWKVGKPAHARKASQEVQAFADQLGLSPLLVAYIALACSAHDLGRMTQGIMRASVTVPPGMFDAVFMASHREVPYDDSDERHGYESVLLLAPILQGYNRFHAFAAGEWLLAAVLHHSLKSNPTLEMCGGSEECLALCLLIRDIDKVLGFQDAGDYTGNPDRKAKERLQNWPKQIETDPEWGMELGRIEPASFLFDTPLETPINRQECKSYEAYMLQFLKWIFGFGSEDMQQVALAEGGPQIVAAYLLKQLEATPDQLRELLIMLGGWRDGVLLRPPQAA